MSSYHNSLTYLNKNSADEGFIIASFEPDNGFTDTFLGMDQVTEDYYDGTKKFFYGNRFNTTATISITLIKADGTDFTLADNRRLLRWLTGARTASWLDLCSEDEIVYSFLGNFTTSQQYKLAGRVVGIQVEFSSITPWAFSAPQEFNCTIGQLIDVLENNDDFVLIKVDTNGSVLDQRYQFGVYADGDDNVLCPDSNSETYFIFDETDGTVYIDNAYRATIDNQSDDLYTYTYLDIDYQNKNGTHISIINDTLKETTQINNVSENEFIQISSKQFIISNVPNKLFGDDFNFVWPRLQPGLNDFIIDGDGNGSAKFTYRYPIKVGDCAMNVDTYGGIIYCNNLTL